MANLEDASKPGHGLVIMLYRGSTPAARSLFGRDTPMLCVGCSPEPDLSRAAATPPVEVAAFPYAKRLLDAEPFKSNPDALTNNDKRFLALAFPNAKLVFITAYLPSLPLKESLHPYASEKKLDGAMHRLMEREETVQVRGSPVGRRPPGVHALSRHAAAVVVITNDTLVVFISAAISTCRELPMHRSQPLLSLLLPERPTSAAQPPTAAATLSPLSLQVLAAYLFMWKDNGYNITLFMDANAAVTSEFGPEDFFVPAAELNKYLEVLQLDVAIQGEGATSRGGRLIDFIVSSSNNEVVAHGKMSRGQGYKSDHDTLCVVYLLPMTGKKG